MESESLKAAEELSASNATHPRVTLDDLKANLGSVAYFTAGEAGDALGIPMSGAARLLTLCIATTNNGFTLVGKSAPASPENFDREKGRTFAYEDVIRQLWPLMGYALRERLSA